jgi:FemAB-related protein (PEP-CTERM system-associated)
MESAPTSSAEEEPLVIRPGSEADDPERDLLVLSHERGTFFHQSGWRRFVERVYGHAPRELVALRGGRIVGILPLFLMPSLSGRRNLLSSPYAVYGGPLGASESIEHELFAAARSLAEELAVGHLELRCLRPLREAGPTSELYVTFLRELPSDPAAILAGMPKKARAEARKAREKHALELSEGIWYLDDLARLFLLNKLGLGSPALPPEHFRALADEVGRAIRVHLVRRGREPLAAVMSFAFRDVLIAYYAGTEPGADRAFSASNFMYMALQEWAVERGFRRFDFCRSRRGSGAFEFKCHQGFEPTQLHYRFHLVRDRRIPDFTPSNPRTQSLQAVWSKLPLWAARRVSRSLSRYLA